MTDQVKNQQSLNQGQDGSQNQKPNQKQNQKQRNPCMQVCGAVTIFFGVLFTIMALCLFAQADDWYCRVYLDTETGDVKKQCYDRYGSGWGSLFLGLTLLCCGVCCLRAKKGAPSKSARAYHSTQPVVVYTYSPVAAAAQANADSSCSDYTSDDEARQTTAVMGPSSGLQNQNRHNAAEAGNKTVCTNV